MSSVLGTRHLLRVPCKNQLAPRFNRKFSSDTHQSTHSHTPAAAFAVFLFIAGAIGVKSYVSNQRAQSELKIAKNLETLKPTAVKHALPAVTIIEYPSVDGAKYSQTQGVVIEDEGYVITTGILCSELIGDKVKVRNFFTEVSGTLHSYDPALRIGLVKLDNPRGLKNKPVSYSPTEDTRMGSSVFSISVWPKGDRPSARFGHISSVNTHNTSASSIDNASLGRLKFHQIQTFDAAGPVFCSSGKLIGFIPACATGSGIVEVISASDLAYIVSQLKLHRHVQLPYFGIQMSLKRDNMTLSDCGDSKVLVESVSDLSPAQQAGIRSGDIIHAVDGRVVYTIEQVLLHLGVKPAKVLFTVHREETSSENALAKATEIKIEVVPAFPGATVPTDVTH